MKQCTVASAIENKTKNTDIRHSICDGRLTEFE